MKLLLIFLLFLFSCKNDRTTIKQVIDGDTYITNNDEKIRLTEIDAPEVAHSIGQEDQLYGQEAKQFAINTLLNKEVGIIRQGKDEYGRTLATIYTLDGTNFAEELVKNGYAHITPWTKNVVLIQEYEQARSQGIGLFKYPYIYPYLWRRQHK